MATLHPVVAAVTERIRRRSEPLRAKYLRQMAEMRVKGPVRHRLSCTNQAHAFAGAPPGDKIMLRQVDRPNIAIVSSYNDMLSAHQPFGAFPAIIKDAARAAGATAQFAGGVPAMCDGVTQGEPGMELSLFSRDVIALATAVSLSHNVFDSVLCLGICDKIVPGLVIGAASFSHLPTILVPGGPMPTGLSNDEKSKVRQLYAQGKVGNDALMEAETKAYHSPGTCTFFGTANSNQMLMEMMGLHLPGSAFVNPGTPLRDALTAAAAKRAVEISLLGPEYTPIGSVIDEKSVVNGIVGLLATGGSTNHTMHLVAMAYAAGILINWDDFSELSAVVPLLARIYPNGKADVNQFHSAGGMGFVIGQLLDANLVHADVTTVAGEGGLQRYRQEPYLDGGELRWRDAPRTSRDLSIVAPVSAPFSADGGLKVLSGNLGRSVIKTSAVKESHRVVEAPALVFESQEAVMKAFKSGLLKQDTVVVVRYQGPRANGMPELHKLTPILGVMQDEGLQVALVTDGRMSGASGKIPAAIHVTPECATGGPLAKIRNGDMIRLDSNAGRLDALVPESEWNARAHAGADLRAHHHGIGRELFGMFRAAALGAEQGAMSFVTPEAADAIPASRPVPVHDEFVFAEGAEER